MARGAHWIRTKAALCHQTVHAGGPQLHESSGLAMSTSTAACRDWPWGSRAQRNKENTPRVEARGEFITTLTFSREDGLRFCRGVFIPRVQGPGGR